MGKCTLLIYWKFFLLSETFQSMKRWIVTERLSDYYIHYTITITSCFYAVQPHMICKTRVMLPSTKRDSVPSTQHICVVCEFLCRWEARYVWRTMNRLADRIKQNVPTSTRKKGNTIREQPPRMCKNNNSKINYESAIGQNPITNPECAKTYIILGSLGKPDRPVI